MAMKAAMKFSSNARPGTVWLQEGAGSLITSLKSLLILFVSCVSFAALAETSSATSANVFGVLRVDSTEKQTVVAIPWLASGVSAGSIKVTDIIKTATLTAGDQLFAYVSSEYKCWALDENKTWQPAQVATATSVLPVAGTGPANQALARGEAIVLVRQNPSSPAYFYVQGQVASSGTVKNTLPAKVWSLLAPPSATATDLNSSDAVAWSITTEASHANDRILFKDTSGNFLTAKRKDGQWKTYDKTDRAWTTKGVSIPAGQGAWYQNASDEAVTVTWKNGPHT